MENIDIIYYINLDHRIDRNTEILSELRKMNISNLKIQRIPAIYTKGFGILGCGLSHLKAVETFMKSEYKNCLILEDDFMFSLDTNYSNFLLNTFFKKLPIFDICMLAGNLMKSEETSLPFIKKVIDAQTASLSTREPVIRPGRRSKSRFSDDFTACENVRAGPMLFNSCCCKLMNIKDFDSAGATLYSARASAVNCQSFALNATRSMS